ncbi:hypothetical protein CH063_06540 [Colletotrichum higginsianum]|uniref:Uncharacterized protein n=1 Tax=Colletotrichum higginsianum (strain IMI 349063) TaxID=759273 RepID=H1V2X2_COLHI|nr:hypothetical protein CH063_06540 [Colletotrichum higginsianum]
MELPSRRPCLWRTERSWIVARLCSRKRSLCSSLWLQKVLWVKKDLRCQDFGVSLDESGRENDRIMGGMEGFYAR